MPLSLSLFIGRRLGDLFFLLDVKHRALAFANIKKAFGSEYNQAQLRAITKKFYRGFGQNIFEVAYFPRFNRQYLDKNLVAVGLENAQKAFSRGKGVIFSSMHAGSWEISNFVCAYFNFPFIEFVGTQQRYPRLFNLLNSFRMHMGCRIIKDSNFLRRMIEMLKDNQAIGVTGDQGGKEGVLVKFFGKEASMPQGPVKLALRYDATIVPVFYRRINGARVEVNFIEAFEVTRSGDLEKDIQDNLQRLTSIFEGYIRRYPYEYLWTYKIWKYGREKEILILSDGKAGHLKQSEALGKMLNSYYAAKGYKVTTKTLEIKFRRPYLKTLFKLGGAFSGKYSCQCCSRCLNTCLEKDSCLALRRANPDVVISCGSSLALANYLVARQNLAKSYAIMRPSFLSFKKFDAVIMPWHDRFLKKKNVIITEGSLNLVDENYVRAQSELLRKRQGLEEGNKFIGLLIGGDSKEFQLEESIIADIVDQLKVLAEDIDASLLVTTSRRTSAAVEALLRAKLKGYARAKLLLITNEYNIPEAVGGILGLSECVVVSPESISMISEAASSGRHVFVFNNPKLSKKHQRFLAHCAEKRYINFVQPKELSSCMKKIMLDHPRPVVLSDKQTVMDFLTKQL